MNPTSMLNSESKPRSIGGVIKLRDDIAYIDIHRDILKALKYILRTALHLTSSRHAKIIFHNPAGSRTIIGLNDEKLEPRKMELVQKCFSTGEVIHLERDEYHSDPDMIEAAKFPHPVMVLPIMTQDSPAFGVLYVEDKIFAPFYTREDITLTKSLVAYLVRLLSLSNFSDNGTELVLNFAVSLSALTDELYISRDNLESRKLISEIIRVSKLINSTLDLQNLLESIMDSAKLVLRSEGASLMLIDERTQELYFNVVAGEKQEELKEIRIPTGQGIAGLVAQSKKAQIVNDAQNDDRVYKQADEKAGFFTRNLIACPLMVRNKIIGVLEVINSIGRDEFSQEDLDLFITFSEQAAIAIHNRELINSLKNTNIELRKKVHELSSLHEISKAMISRLNEKELFDSVVKIIAEELEARKCSIMIFDEKNKALEVISSYGLTAGEQSYRTGLENSLAGVAFLENRVIFSGELESGPLAQFRNKERYETGTCIIYPISHENAKFGVINIAEKINGENFSQNDFQLVTTIAGQITKAVENFRLLDEMLEKKAVEKELEITSSIQKSILPAKSLHSEFFDLGFLSYPAKLMGGDFYDFDSFSSEQFSFLIADVSGKSLPAALFMAVTSSIIRTLNREEKSPGELMSQANDLIYRDSQAGMFVTLFYTTLDAATGEVKYASAGHNEQIVYRAKTGEFEYLDARGGPLGVLPTGGKNVFQENSTRLEKDDMIILYTDGIVEAINDNQEEFGLERFLELLKTLTHLEPMALSQEIYRKVTEFASNQPQFDDFTILIVKLKQEPGKKL